MGRAAAVALVLFAAAATAAIEAKADEGKKTVDETHRDRGGKRGGLANVADALKKKGRILPELAKLHDEVMAEVVCLALNIYHEARGEEERGRLAIAQATMNRMSDERFPRTICAVLDQPGQFSWNHRGKTTRLGEKEAWNSAQRLALDFFKNDDHEDLVGERKFFAAKRAHSRIGWMKRARNKKIVGEHMYADFGIPYPRYMRKGTDAFVERSH